MEGPTYTRSRQESDLIDTLLSVLADERRRIVLSYLMSSEDDIATVDELVEYTTNAVSTEETKPLEVTFHHAILPHLAEAGYIEYDPRSQIVRYRGRPLQERVLDLVTRAEASA